MAIESGLRLLALDDLDAVGPVVTHLIVYPSDTMVTAKLSEGCLNLENLWGLAIVCRAVFLSDDEVGDFIFDEIRYAIQRGAPVKDLLPMAVDTGDIAQHEGALDIADWLNVDLRP
jgi:hypothetical protein